ncbi:MAG: membrane-like protein [Sphingobium sp.]
MALCVLLCLAGCGGDHTDQPVAQEADGRNPAPASASVPANPAVPDKDAAPEYRPSSPDRAPSPARSPAPTPMPVDMYRAIGTEPFWTVDIRGTRATLERMDHRADHFTVSRTDDGRAIRYRGDGFAMTVTPGPCSDGMSDTLWSDRVQIAFTAGVLKGCGGAREDMPRDAP